MDSAQRDDDDGIFAFARVAGDGSRVIVVVNASDGDSATGELTIDGSWKTVLVVGPEELPALINKGRRLPAPPQSVTVWVRGREE